MFSWGTVMSTVHGVLGNFGFKDVVDILLISFVIYKVIKIVRETRAEQLLKGIVLLIAALLLASFCKLKVTSLLLQTIFDIGLLTLVVLFQPELRRVLERMGRMKVPMVFGGDSWNSIGNPWEPVIPILVESVARLSSSCTGALVVLERSTKLGEQISTGVALQAKPSVELFGNIFFVNTPLHDGAVIMRDGQILAAACFLPKPSKEELIATHLGSRHRAAIGISEISDSITIVVSEETGTVSVAENGELLRGFSSERLSGFLKMKLLSENTVVERKPFFRRNKKK